MPCVPLSLIILQTTKSKYILTVFEDKSLNLEYSIHLMELLSNQKIPCPMPIKSKANETIKILRTRGDAMQNAVPKGEGGMTAVLGSTVETVEEILEKNKDNFTVQIANDNSEGQIVLRGKNVDLDKLTEVLKQKSIKNIKRMMEKEAKKENFMQAAILRDELFRYKKLLLEKFDD